MTNRFFVSWVTRIALCSASALVLLLGLRTPGAAADTSYLSLQGPNPVTAPCPMTLSFNGSITGAPNSTVTYLWARFVNNKSQDSAPVTTQIPPNGTLTLPPQQLSVDKSTQGFQSYDLYVAAPANSDSTTHGKVFFTANCKTLVINPGVITQANPTVKINKNVIVQVYVAPPDHLAQTGDAQLCGSHGAGFVCLGGFANGWLGLVWCWGQSSCGPASTDENAKGFNIYEVDNGQHALVTSIGADQYGSLPTAGFVQTPNGGFANQCYAVTVVQSNNNESSLSNSVCLGNGTVGNVTTTYHAVDSTIMGKGSEYNESSTFPTSSSECSPGPLCLGWYHDESSVISPSTYLIWSYNDNFRTYYRFDLSSISGHYVVSAVLRVPITGGSLTCLGGIAAADTAWSGNSPFMPWIGGSFSPPNGSIGTGIDVTDIVRSWISGLPNYGFVLRGSDERLDAEASKCLTKLGTDATLDIVHS